MKKFDKNDYNFIDLSETDISQFSQIELDKMLADTKELLNITKGGVKNTPMNISPVSGLLAARGGEFKKINAITGAKWKKGNTTKEERKLINKVFNTGRLYYTFKIVINLVKQQAGEWDILKPTLAQKTK